MTVSSTTTASYENLAADRAASSHLAGLAVVTASALAGLLAVTAIATGVARVLGSASLRPAASVAAPAARDENTGDSRHGSAREDGQRRSGGADAAATQIAQRWLLVGLTGTAQASVRTDLTEAVPAVQPLLATLAQVVSVDAATGHCPGGASSCSYRDQGVDGRWGIHLDAHTTSATYPSNRFLVYHEIGHAVWGLLLDDTDRQAFVAAVRAALHGRPCTDGHGRVCAALQEVFADEFARYAGGFAVSMSMYRTPPLLDVPTFSALAAHWTAS